MNHDKLLTEAREWADKLCPIKGVPFPDGRPGGTLESSPPTGDTLAAAATAICTLADLVEKYSKSNTQLIAACNAVLAGPVGLAWAQDTILTTIQQGETDEAR